MSASGSSKVHLDNQCLQSTNTDPHHQPTGLFLRKLKPPSTKSHQLHSFLNVQKMERATTGWDPNSVEPPPNCPRCGSCNTKFCYYNNYSLTQPRYFCKGCRRYWTRGGSLRNVPIGGTCRRSRRIVKPRLTAFHIASNNNRSIGYGGGHHLSYTSSSLPSLESRNNPNNIDLAQLYTSFLNQNPRTLDNSVHPGLHHPSGGIPRVESESSYTFYDGSFKFISKFDQIQEKDEDEEEGILQTFMGCDHLLMTTNNFGFMPPLPGGLEGLGWPRPTHVGSPTNLMILENIVNSKELFPHGVGQNTPQDRYI